MDARVILDGEGGDGSSEPVDSIDVSLTRGGSLGYRMPRKNTVIRRLEPYENESMLPVGNVRPDPDGMSVYSH